MPPAVQVSTSASTSPSANPPSELLEAFAPLTWAVPLLESQDWKWRPRDRHTKPGERADAFARDILRSWDCASDWVEAYQKPAPGTTVVKKALLLCKYGTGFSGYPGICHGGVVMTLMDEALGSAMVACESERVGGGSWVGVDPEYKKMVEQGLPLEELLKGYCVTAKLDVKFLRPVPCPGVVGVETDVLEDNGSMMKMRAVMKDANGTPLMQVDGLYVRVGGAPKGSAKL
jgi:acyl-coenzyme A thioesterase PaaI-like protein